MRYLPKYFLIHSFNNASRSAWRKDNDNISQFVDDMCVIEEGARVASGALYHAYIGWADGQGIVKKLQQNNFTKRLQKFGAMRSTGNGGVRMIENIRVKTPVDQQKINKPF